MVQHPSRVRSIAEVVLPEPHMDEEVLGRPYLGVYGSSEAEDTQPVYVRLPLPILALTRRIAEDRRNGYDGTVSAVLRHALLELLWLHWQRDEENIYEPELVQYLRQQEALCLAAFEAERGLTQEKALRLVEASMAKSVERGNIRSLHTSLKRLDSLLTGSLSETWTGEFKWLLARSPVVHKAVNAIMASWAESDDPREQRIAEEWQAWFNNLDARKASNSRKRRTTSV